MTTDPSYPPAQAPGMPAHIDGMTALWAVIDQMERPLIVALLPWLEQGAHRHPDAREQRVWPAALWPLLDQLDDAQITTWIRLVEEDIAAPTRGWAGAMKGGPYG